MLLSFVTVIILLMMSVSYRPVYEFNEDYMSISNCVNLRGVMAIGIILCHVLLEIPSNEVGLASIFLHCGYLFVAVFFFLSGYGMFVSWRKKGRLYLNTIWKKLLYFFVLYVATNLFYLLVCYLRGKQIAFDYFLSHQPFLGTTWYLIMLSIMYITFYVSCHITKSDHALFVITLMFIILLSFILKRAQFHVMWYCSTLSFPFGIAFGTYKKRIDIVILHHWIMLFLALIFIFVLFSFSDVFCNWFDIRDYSRMLSSTAFSLLVICCLAHLTPRTKFWEFIGLHSLEIYLLHAPIYFLLRSKVVYINNSALYVVITIILTLLLSVPVKKANGRIYDKIRSL